MITYHVNEVVNWGMASALALLLLIATAILLVVFGRLVKLRPGSAASVMALRPIRICRGPLLALSVARGVLWNVLHIPRRCRSSSSCRCLSPPAIFWSFRCRDSRRAGMKACCKAAPGPMPPRTASSSGLPRPHWPWCSACMAASGLARASFALKPVLIGAHSLAGPDADRDHGGGHVFLLCRHRPERHLSRPHPRPYRIGRAFRRHHGARLARRLRSQPHQGGSDAWRFRRSPPSAR